MKNTTGKIWFSEIIIFIFCFLAISYFIGIIIDAYFSVVSNSTALHQFPIEGR